MRRGLQRSGGPGPALPGGAWGSAAVLAACAAALPGQGVPADLPGHVGPVLDVVVEARTSAVDARADPQTDPRTDDELDPQVDPEARPDIGPVWSVSRGGLFCRRSPGGELERTWSDDRVRLVALAAVGARDGLVSVGGIPARRGVLVRFDAAGRETSRTELGRDLLYCVAVVPGLGAGPRQRGPRLLVGAADGRLLELRPAPEGASGTEGAGSAPAGPRGSAAPETRVLVGRGPACRAVAVAPGGRFAAAGWRDGTLRIFDLTDPAAAAAVDVPGHTAAVEAVAWSRPDRDRVGAGPGGGGDGGLRLASADRDGRLRIHDTAGSLSWSSAPLGAVALDVAPCPSAPGASLVGLADGRVVRVTRRQPAGDPLPAMDGRPGPVHALGLLALDPGAPGTY